MSACAWMAQQVATMQPMSAWFPAYSRPKPSSPRPRTQRPLVIAWALEQRGEFTSLAAAKALGCTNEYAHSVLEAEVRSGALIYSIRPRRGKPTIYRRRKR